MNAVAKGLGILLVSAGIVSCQSTEIKDHWRDPTLGAESLQFNRILALAITGDDVTRRIAEDELVRQIRRSNAVASYSLISPTDLENPEKTKGIVKSHGFDGVVIMELISVDEVIPYSSRAAREPFSWYAGYAVPTEPVRPDTLVTVETRIHSVELDKAVWRGRSETFNRFDTREVVDDISRAVIKNLQAEGLLRD